MKYAIQARLLFETKTARDELFAKLKGFFDVTYKDNDTHIQKHMCYHDEDKSKPCIIEEHIT